MRTIKNLLAEVPVVIGSLGTTAVIPVAVDVGVKVGNGIMTPFFCLSMQHPLL